MRQIEEYLSAPLKNLTPPARWPLLPAAARLLANSLLTGKKLAVWGDYDVDGITATALVLDVLEHHGFSALYHLPDRLNEGYGLNCQHVETLAQAGCEVLLTVDCGIGDLQAIERANEMGMQVIVSDHHLPPAQLPRAAAFVNPRMEAGESWPCPHLAGVGVAFYLMAAVNALLAEHTGRRYRMDDALDLTALGTLADVMLLEGENRILVRAGLAKLEKPLRPGMAALKIASGFDLAARLNSGQAVFRLAPRLNAAGRMGNPALALKLLRSRDYRCAAQLAEELNVCNIQRKDEEDRAYREARAQAKDLLEEDNYAGLTLFGADWHPGVVGIVASRIVEEFNRPAIVLCEDNGTLKGSGRSAHGFDLYAGLGRMGDCLLGYGGHRLAAGVRLAKDKLEPFRRSFSEVIRAVLGDEPRLTQIIIEGELPFKHASNHVFLNELQLMQPFGPGNPEPVFASLPLIIRKRTPLGHSGEHVRLELEEEGTGAVLAAKAWRMAREFPESMIGERIRAAYTPKIDVYNGIANIDLGIKDWKKV